VQADAAARIQADDSKSSAIFRLMPAADPGRTA
jgi:hypothetical protein